MGITVMVDENSWPSAVTTKGVFPPAHTIPGLICSGTTVVAKGGSWDSVCARALNVVVVSTSLGIKTDPALATVMGIVVLKPEMVNINGGNLSKNSGCGILGSGVVNSINTSFWLLEVRKAPAGYG